MRVKYGLYEAWITPEFYLERGKAYNADDPEFSEIIRRHPDAFTSDLGDVPGFEEFEQATEAPGERRNTRRPQ